MTADVFYIKKGDLEPPLEFTLSGSKGDLSLVTEWRVIGRIGGDTLFNRVIANEDFAIGAVNTTGTLVYRWQAGDTDTVGELELEVKALWPDARPQTFPPKNFTKVIISESLG